MPARKQINGSSGYTLHNSVKLIRGGKEYFDALLQMISEANHTIHLQTYIFSDDETGQMIAQALMQACRRGVKVYLLADGYASRELSEIFIQQLKDAGILFRWFQPVLKSRHFYFGRRFHCKIFLADGTSSLVGGVNISNRYNDLPGKPAWMDWALFTEGEVNEGLFYLCRDMWNKSGWGKRRNRIINTKPAVKIPEQECMVRMRSNDWIRRKNQVTKSYLKMITGAQSQIIIMSSYFLPGRLIKKSLLKAAQRGVKIKIIAAGKSDIMLAKHAERYIYRWILKNDIELYEYQSNILHGKLSTCDGQWMTVGSYNINDISAYASIELNMEVWNDAFVKEVEASLNEIIRNDCELITETLFIAHNNIFKRLWQKICYQMFRIIFYLFTFYFKQEK